MTTHVAIPHAVAKQYWHLPFSELVRLATDHINGICDAVVRDRALWEETKIDPGERYDGIVSEGGRRRLKGYAIMREGSRGEFGRGDVAVLYIQNFTGEPL